MKDTSSKRHRYQKVLKEEIIPHVIYLLCYSFTILCLKLLLFLINIFAPRGKNKET